MRKTVLFLLLQLSFFGCASPLGDGDSKIDANYNAGVREGGQASIGYVYNLATPTMASSWSMLVPIVISGPASANCSSGVTSTSSNSAVISNASLTVSGAYPNCVLTISVSGNTTGSTTITLSATYGNTTAGRSFNLYLLPPAAAAFSTRLAVLGYAGSALKVRHGSTNAEANIAFDSDGTVSPASVAKITAVGTSGWSLNQEMTFSAFYAGASVFVKTWYDQSGNGVDAIQATTSSQPRIVNAGSMDVISGRAAINFDTTLVRFVQTGAFDLASGRKFYVTAVTQSSTYRTFKRAYVCRAGYPLGYLGGGNIDGTVTSIAGSVTTTAPRITVTSGGHILSQIFSTAGLAADVNGILLDGGSLQTLPTQSGALCTTGINIGGNGTNAVETWDGNIAELIFIPGAVTATDRQTYEAVPKRIFGTP